MNCNEVLIQIEDLMLSICSGKYHWKEAEYELEDYREVATNIYDPDLEYSPMLQGYFDLMSISHSLDLHGRTKRDSSLFRSRTDFIDFCDGLLDEHDRFINRHKRQRRRNFKVLKKNFEDLLDRHCKLLLVRVDVSYLYDANKDICQFDADLNTFRRLIHLRHDCFEHVLDYSWAIEQGRNKGYHCHFLFIYNGSKHMRDGYFAEQISKTWLDVTDDDGCYFSCNRKSHKDNYLRQGTLGIGTIQRNHDEVEKALNAIGYLASADKEDQHLRAKIKGMRCFG